MKHDYALTDLIYESALLPELWPQALDALSARMGGIGGLLFTADGSGWTCSAPIHDTFQRIVEEGWLNRNSRLSRSLAAGLAHHMVTDLQIFTTEEMDVDPLYRALRSRGWGWFAGMAVGLPRSSTAVFSFERSFEAGPYDDAEAQILADHRSHLARATLLTARLGFERHATMAETLAHLGLPAAVLGRGGQLLASNALFEAAVPAIVWDRRGRIRLADAAADRRLATTLARLDLGLDGETPLSLALKPQEGMPARLLNLLPIRRAARDLLTGSVSLAVMTPAETRSVLDATHLMTLFGLSRREAALALSLAEGDTLAGYADRAGVSTNTARSQLKCVFEKTGVRRQAELITLLARLSGP